MHGLQPAEIEAILAQFDTWSEIDRSHRKLAHRGSYTGVVYVSPNTIKRVLASHGLRVKTKPRPRRSTKTPFPD